MNKFLIETEMNKEKLKTLLDIYGADLTRMPKDVAGEIKTFLTQIKDQKFAGSFFDHTDIDNLFTEAKELD